ncbi:MAG TPA: hypothetical protein VF941_13670 [Clostridia bacterium]
MQGSAADSVNKACKSAAELSAGIFDKIKSFVLEFTNRLIKKTNDMDVVKGKSIDDYFKIGSLYVLKRFVAISIIFLILLFYFISFFALPYMLNKFLFHKYYFDSKELEGFNGRAKIMVNVSPSSKPKSSKDSSVLIYDGEMFDGKCSGYGTLYSKDQKLKYSGEFKLNNYDGKGSLYCDNGLLYQGDFKSGSFDGSGNYYYPYCKVKYAGGFKNGLYDGEGIISYKNNILIYNGNFKQGKYNGQGVLYNIFNNKIYSGNFSDGLYDGQGIEYSFDTILYKGSFQHGKYNGQGILYNIMNKSINYEGSFLDGAFDGSGKLYYFQTQTVKYEGEFKNGLFNGTGTLYDKNIRKLYQGPFIHGNINYLYVLGMPATEIKTTFPAAPDIDTEIDTEKASNDTYSYLTYTELGATLVMSPVSTPGALTAAPLPPEIQENVSSSYVDKIILWDKYEISGIDNTMSADKVSSILGKPLYDTSYSLSSIDNKAIWVKKAAGYEKNIELDHLYFESFALDGYTINIAFESRSGNQLYMILSKDPIIRGLG